MINKALGKIIEKYNVKDTKNIIYGTNIPMPKVVIPTPWATYINFEKVEYYFFYFSSEGVRIYPISGDGYIDIPWEDVLDFKMRHILIVGKMSIKTKDATYKFQINRAVIGCPWIRKNIKYLESVHYFYRAKK